jgi:hypothetical protein
MRTHIASLLLLFIAGAAAGCGQVDDGQCATAEQSDNVACTLDICNAEAGGWAHIPNNELCEAGQACSPTAGCVAAGALTGTATLFGYTDHSNITVTVDGLEGVSTTTDAMGNWTIVVPPGMYTVTYSKEKFRTERSDNIVVLAEAAERAASIELMHGVLWGDERETTTSYSATTNPDRTYLIETPASEFGTSYYATPMDGSSPPKLVTSLPSGTVAYSKTHMVWTTGTTGACTNSIYTGVPCTIWARPLDASTPPVRLFAAAGDVDTMSIVQSSNRVYAYTIIRTTRFNSTAGFTETSFWVAKTDGSANPTVASWVQPDSLHPASQVVYNDTTALLLVNNNTNTVGAPSDTLANTPLIRIDLATRVATPVNVGFATNAGAFITVSPNSQVVLGYLSQTLNSSGYVHRRTFMAQLSGTAAPNLAPIAGASSSTSSQYSDYPAPSYGWMSDSSGIVFQAQTYTSASATTLGGELKVWMATSATAATIAPYNTSGFGVGIFAGGPYLVGKAFVYADGSSPSRVVKVANLSSTPQSYPLDSTGFDVMQFSFSVTDSSAYIVWAQATGASTYTPEKILSANLTFPVTAAPAVTQLGPALNSGGCVTGGFFSPVGALSGTTFFKFCYGSSGTTVDITAYPKSSTAQSGTAPGVPASSFGGPIYVSIAAADRIAFRRSDGNWYSLGADLKPLAVRIDQTTTPSVVDQWVFFRDSSSLMTRVSRGDGAIIDEPLLPCDLGSAYLNDAKSQAFWPSSRCSQATYMMHSVGVTNLP